ncbi:MAG: 4-demethylwyosine synthase TYW1 [Candidatus Aenigmarchaeota archaeon]|nr:4-demethylwyosine synthase TYW1 [Candidatus Aenigmarchaeota archaeon]
MAKLAVSEKDKKDLIKKHYRILGNHGAVEICTWTKRALRGQGVCYKEKFYGVDCHRCAQITPLALWCDQNCVFCWRPMENMNVLDVSEDDVDDPQKILDDVIPKRWNLLNGMKGNDKVDEKFAKDLKVPNHYAISLSGEPTLYPKLGEMVKLLRAKPEVRTIFIVTNGQNPEVLERLANDNALPTQLYVSLAAPNEKLFQEINRSVRPDGWERLNRSLDLLGKLPTRTVVRLTVIKGINDADEYLKDYAEIIGKSQADFVEIKSYMHIGYSQHRLEKKNMPTHEELREFALRLEKILPDYGYSDEARLSRIVLLKNKKSKYENMIKPEEK